MRGFSELSASARVVFGAAAVRGDAAAHCDAAVADGIDYSGSSD